MSKLSKEKRNQLILIAMVTVGVMFGLWYFLISFQRGKLSEAANRAVDVQKQIEKTQKVMRESAEIETELKAASSKLALIESRMPSGDLFAWMINSIKQFNVAAYKVELPQIGSPSVGEVSMFADFPYHQATVQVAGTAYYYDLGKFIADFENHFPYARIQNLSLEPGGSTATPDEREKLAFHMEIITLVKVSNP